MSKILLILGSGPNIGSHLVKAFSQKGYKVAVASRSAPKNDDGSDLHIPIDLAQPETVPAVFQTVREKLGGEPGVVVYNGECMYFYFRGFE
jgi:NAD(P)-dependent dehydrogenase (short-subunit alcohol dehydrogenase family)